MEHSTQPEKDQIPIVIQADSEPVVIPVIEERLQLGKEIIETGKVIIRKQVDAEQVALDIPIIQEQAQVERVPRNEYVETAPQVRYEGDTMIIPVVREEMVLTKRLVLVEEVWITKHTVLTPASQTVTLRKETVTVERTAVDPLDMHSTE